MESGCGIVVVVWTVAGLLAVSMTSPAALDSWLALTTDVGLLLPAGEDGSLGPPEPGLLSPTKL